jgi:hypothetical protein
MKRSIFIRSYQGDIQWLKYALQSIHKFCSGWDEIVIVVPKPQLSLFKELNLTVERLETCPVYPNDYIGQQLTKLEAYNYTDADIITFWDSDVIAFENTTPDDYIVNNKPILYKTHYNHLKGDQGYLWKERTEKAFGHPLEFEYMRRLPLTYHASTLKSLNIYFKLHHNKSFQQYMEDIQGNDFSEFNLVGAYVDKYENDKYAVLDTDTVTPPPVKARQFWSWSKLTPEEETTIQQMIK